MALTPIRDAVFISTDPLCRLNANDINQLKYHAGTSGLGRVRLCAHRTSQDSIQEMVIVIRRNSYVVPHKHLDNFESFHVIDGRAELLIFNEFGEVTDIVQLGDYGSGYNFFHRLPPNTFHTVLVRSDHLIIHEVTSGPYDPSKTVRAKFAPEQTDEARAGTYLHEITKNFYAKNRTNKASA
jgi:cupin fold WbuC family metalloprotein